MLCFAKQTNYIISLEPISMTSVSIDVIGTFWYVYRGTIEMPQRGHTFQVNCCLKVHNAHLKLLSPILG